MKRLTNKPALIVTSIALQLSMPVKAQSIFESQEAEKQTITEEVIVTGTKIEQSLQDVEVSTEVFDTRRLEQQQINEISDLLLKVPNVNTSGGADSNFSIRGIGRGGVGGAGTGVTSNIYIDGAPITSTAINRSPSSLWDVSQVEVLRGPQSSVQGRNALAGAVIVKTADPTFDPEGKFKTTIAEGNTHQLAGAFGGAIIDDLLAGRVSIDIQGSDGFVTSGLPEIEGDDLSTFDSVAARAKFLLAPASTGWFTSKLTIDYSESEVDGADNVSVQAPDIEDGRPGFLNSDFDPTDLITFDEPRNNDNEGLRIVNETGFDLNDALTLRSIITYEDYETVRTFGDLNDLTLFNENILNQFEETIYSGELRLEFDTDNIKSIVGLYYFQSNDKRDSNTQIGILGELQDRAPLALNPLISVTPEGSSASLQNNVSFETENYAVFGQVDWELSTKWSLGLGARYDVETFDEISRTSSNAVSNDVCAITAPEAVLLGSPSLEPLTLPCLTVVDAFVGVADQPPVRADFDAFLPRASLTYDINDNSSVFISASRGYRAGGSFVALENNPGELPTFIVGTFEPEFLTTYEIGTRNIFLDGNLTLNANAFFSNYEDQQLSVDVSDPDSTRDDIVVNAGESTIYGIELLADYHVNDNTNVFLTVGLLETEFDDFPFAVDADGNPSNPDDPQFANLAGNSFPGAADISFTIGANWEGDNGFFANADFTLIGESESAVQNIDNNDIRAAFTDLGLDPDLASNQTTTSDTRTSLSARFGWSNDSMSLYVFGTNLLDEDSIATQTIANVGAEDGTLDFRNQPSFTLQQPRTIGAGVEFSF